MKAATEKKRNEVQDTERTFGELNRSRFRVEVMLHDSEATLRSRDSRVLPFPQCVSKASSNNTRRTSRNLLRASRD